MKRIKQVTILAILAIGMLSSSPAEAKERKDKGENYIKDGHLWVWNANIGKYEDMGAYNPCHGC